MTPAAGRLSIDTSPQERSNRRVSFEHEAGQESPSRQKRQRDDQQRRHQRDDQQRRHQRGDQHEDHQRDERQKHRRQKSPAARQDYYPVGSPGALDRSDGSRVHASEVDIGKLLKEDVVRLKIVETPHAITIGDITYQKQDLADACQCGVADKCWAVAMSSKPWPLKLHACNHHSEPEHASHDSPCHVLSFEQVKTLRALREAAGK